MAKPATQPAWATYDELAHELQVNRATIWRWVQSGRVPPPVEITPQTKRFNRAAFMAALGCTEQA